MDVEEVLKKVKLENEKLRKQFDDYYKENIGKLALNGERAYEYFLLNRNNPESGGDWVVDAREKEETNNDK